jgi:hypothetical protein
MIFNLFQNILDKTKSTFANQDPTQNLQYKAINKLAGGVSAVTWQGMEDPTQSLMFKGIQGGANLYTWVTKGLQQTAQADIADKQKKIDDNARKYASHLASKGYSQEKIFQTLDLLKKEWKLTASPNFAERLVWWLGDRMGTIAEGTQRLSQEDNLLKRMWAGTAFYGGSAVATAMTPVGAALQPVVEPIVRPIMETAPAQSALQYASRFDKENPIASLALQWVGNLADLAPVPLVKPIASGIKKGAVATWKGIVRWAEKIAPKVVQPVKNLWQTIWQKYTGIRKYLAGIEPKEVTALEKTSAKEFDDILNKAKEAVWPNADYTQTPYYIFDEANDALSKIEDNLSARQAERLAVLDEAPIATIKADDARNTLKSALRSMNVEDIRIVDGKIEIIPVKWREALLDMSNPADVKALQKLNEILDWDVSPIQTMDRIKKLQEWAYENKSTIGVKWVSERMWKLIKQVQGSLNSTFKKQLPPEYAKILDSMSEDIKLSDDMRRLFWIDDQGNQVWNRGELLMKRILNGPTTGWEAKKLADQILKKYWIDFTRQARLRQLAMDLVWDDRAKTFFQAAQEWKSSLVDTVLQKTIGKVVNKEWVMRNLAKWKWDTILKPKPIYTPNAFRKAMAEEAKKPKALPSPSGKATWAKNFRVNQQKEAPKVNSDITSKSKIVRPWTKAVLKEDISKTLLNQKAQAQKIINLKREIQTSTDAARFGGTGNSRIESGIQSAINKWTITIDEAKALAREILKEVESGNWKYSYVNKQKLKEYVDNFTWVSKWDDLDALMASKGSNPQDTVTTPKMIYDKLNQIANDGRYWEKSFNDLAEKFKQMTGKDVLDMSFDDFDKSGNLKVTPSPKPLSTTATKENKWVVVPEKSKKLATSKKIGTESKWGETGGKTIVKPVELTTRKDFQNAVENNDIAALKNSYSTDKNKFNTMIEWLFWREKLDRLTEELTWVKPKGGYWFIWDANWLVWSKNKSDFLSEYGYKKSNTISLLEKQDIPKLEALVKETEKNILKQEKTALNASESQRTSWLVRVIWKNPWKAASMNARVSNAFETLDKMKEDLKLYKDFLNFKKSNQPKPLSPQKTVKPKNLTESKQSATIGDMETKKLTKKVLSKWEEAIISLRKEKKMIQWRKNPLWQYSRADKFRLIQIDDLIKEYKRTL